ncbi:YggS family pyridoxal phosphate-dependent enzyme [Nocardioides sp. SYSU DS0651]|uniref:YggS family pyridoxal phosphate-dependent enzyme n=1 Tax=Nocardioides sp. SYSU DS0651 TaxID=3415955 RepID=UPI003F4C97D8
MTPGTDRRAEVAAGLRRVHERIAAACAQAGRPADEVRLVVVTKFFPASDVELLAELGVTDVGENRHQEAEEKVAACAEGPAAGLVWHFIGGLQRNKAAAVARYAAVVESVDRPELLPRLARGAAESGRQVDVLLQVSLDPPGSDHRAGVPPDRLAALAEQAAGVPELRLRGLMAVAPLGEDPTAAFGRLAEVRETFLVDHPDATVLSAGMSGDLEAAVQAGATHVRVGTAVLGSRPAVQ